MGIVLIGVEVFVVPGFGVFGVLGIVAFLGGVFMAQIGSLPTQADLGRAAGVLSAAIILVFAATWFFLQSMFGSWRLKRSGVILPETTDRDEGYTSADVRTDMEGAEGVAITDLRPAGVGLFGEERMDVVSESEWIEEGTRIRVLTAEGYRHVVRAMKPSAEESDGTD